MIPTKNLLLIIAALLIAAWIIGFIGYSSAGIVNLLPIGAGLMVILSVLEDKSQAHDGHM